MSNDLAFIATSAVCYGGFYLMVAALLKNDEYFSMKKVIEQIFERALYRRAKT